VPRDPTVVIEPTPEEIEAEKKRQIQILKRRESCRRWREKKKAELTKGSA